jgi:hypothetical protein
VKINSVKAKLAGKNGLVWLFVEVEMPLKAIWHFFSEVNKGRNGVLRFQNRSSKNYTWSFLGL